MKLIRFEWLKLSNKRNLWLILICCLIGNAIFYYYEQQNNSGNVLEQREQYKQLISHYDRMNPTDALQELEHIIGDVHTQLDLWYEKQAASPERTEHVDQLSSTLQLHSIIKDQLNHIINHEQFLNGIEEKSNTMLSVSIFQQQQSFSYRNIIETAQAFSQQKNAKLQLGMNEPIYGLINHVQNDYIIIFFMLIIGFYMFHYERENSLYLLIRSTRYGKLRTIVSKLTIYCATISIVFILVYGVILAMNGMLYGYDNLSRSIQSVPNLSRGEYLLSVGQFLVYFLLLKWGSFIFIAAIMAVLFICIQHLGKLQAVASCIIIIEYLCYLFIHPYSPISTLKYVNVFYILRADSLLTYYRNINLLGFPVPALKLILYVIILGSIVCFILCSLLFCSKYGDADLRKNWLSFLSVWKQKLLPPTRSHSIFRHEYFKSFISNKGYVVLICALVFCYVGIQKEPVTLDDVHRVYLVYIDKYGGALTEQNLLAIEEEKQRLDQLVIQLQQLEQSLMDKTITNKEYVKQVTPLQQQTYLLGGFYKLYNQVGQLQQLQINNEQPVMLINSMADTYMFEHKFRSALTAIFLTIFIIMSQSSTVTTDYRAKLNLLQQSTINGRLKLWRMKRYTSYVAVCCLFFIVQLPPYLNIVNYYPGFYWSAPSKAYRYISMYRGRSIYGSIY